MIYLIFGPDTYRSHERLLEITKKYSSSQGFEKIDGEKVSWNDLERILITPGFFEEKKLIVINNLFLKSKAEVYQKVLKNIKTLLPEMILIFYEQGGIKKSISNKLPKESKKEEFLPLIGTSEYNWIRQEVTRLNGRIDPLAVQKLSLYGGSDLWRLSREINKLVSYRKGRLIVAEDVELLVSSPLSSNIFDLIDALGNKDLNRALRELNQLLESGENELYLFTMIVYQFRNLIQIRELYDRGLNQFQIKDKTGIHPYVIRKTLNQARNFKLVELKKIYRRLLDAETNIKTGRSEPKVLLDLLIFGLAS